MRAAVNYGPTLCKQGISSTMMVNDSVPARALFRCAIRSLTASLLYRHSCQYTNRDTAHTEIQSAHSALDFSFRLLIASCRGRSR